MIHYNRKKLTISSARARASQPASTLREKLSPWFARLYPEQKRAADFILSRPATALFCAPGTGKTFISMAVLELSEWKLALIVAPLTSLDTVWSPKLKTLLLHKCHRSFRELQESLKADKLSNQRRILLINPESLRSVAKRIAKLAWDVVIWDESQNIKSRSSASSRVARRLRHVPRRIALSGTPIDSGQIDIWAQMRFVDHEVFGENWGDFANEYCRKSGWMGKEWKFVERKHPQFLEALKDHIFRLDDKFLKLKPLTITPVPIEMLGKQRRFYEMMRRDNLIEIDGTIISANNAGARDIKLAQITGGAVLDEDGISHSTGQAKRRKLLHILRKDEWPIVIFCQFLHEIDIILELFDDEPHSVAVVRGSVKGKERTKIIDDFQAGRYDCLICQIRTGGESINLTRANTLIMYSINFSYINWEQVLRRVYRGGQKRAVKILILYCVDTIDEDKIELIKEKNELSENVLGNFEEKSTLD